MIKSKNVVLGIMAHVDAGKTTLSEALLYLSGMIRKAGRVDNKDAFLDTNALERARGITIFSKQAILKMSEEQTVTLLDTPGHVDFSAEMERTLQVLDYAILVISGADGVQGHTRTLWRLLKRYQIPTFIFVNKMDQAGTDRGRLLEELREVLHENCVDFADTASEEFYENVATCDERTLEAYLEIGVVGDADIRRLVQERKLFPCFFGSALKMEGVTELLEGIMQYGRAPEYPLDFGAKVFKIGRDEQGKRLTYLKVTGGSLKVKQLLSGQKKIGQFSEGESGDWEEKVNQIRIYSGEKYEAVDEASAGVVCAVTGLNDTYPGQGLGAEKASDLPILEPVLTYTLGLPEGCDAAVMLPKLRLLEEEEPGLHIVWNEKAKEIQAQLMGEVQIEVLQSLIEERFGVRVTFGAGSIVYKETIENVVEGVGHFEPLRHYAEVHLLMEPQEQGSGISFAANCSEDLLDRNWQRLVLTHLKEREHIGVLTGAPITDMKITLVSGRAHLKHTEGGDFRQATYRALRQGLMQAQSVLLEPYYEFSLEIPEDAVGRAMTDIERMHGKIVYDMDGGAGEGNSVGAGSGGRANDDAMHGGISMRNLHGTAPVATMQNYQKEVIAYTRGQGRLTCTPGGYRPCHNAEEVIAQIGYEPEHDLEHPTGSVFCAHGAGFVVNWDEVENYMHLERWLDTHRKEDGVWVAGMGMEAQLENGDSLQNAGNMRKNRQNSGNENGISTLEEEWIGTEEIDRILEQTYNANKRDKSVPAKNSWKLKDRTKNVTASVTREYKPQPKQEEYLLVDGYNIIFAWEELKILAANNIDGARGRLLDILSNYQGIRGCQLIVVFDAYRVQGHQTETFDYHNIHVVYTKEAETADQYIEKFAHENARKYRVTVATSDGLEQIIIRGAGCELLSARDLEEEVCRRNQQIQEEYAGTQEKCKNYLLDGMAWKP